MKDLNDKATIDLFPAKKQRGGWRGGGRPKGKSSTVAVRVDVRLLPVIDALTRRLQNLDESVLDVRFNVELNRFRMFR